MPLNDVILSIFSHFLLADVTKGDVAKGARNRPQWEHMEFWECYGSGLGFLFCPLYSRLKKVEKMLMSIKLKSASCL